jgi:hypothetical protein
MKIGFFETCSRELDECTGYKYRPRMQPWTEPLNGLYGYAQKHGIPFVFTTCCSGNLLSPDSRKDVLFIPVDGANTEWKNRVKDFRLFYVEKITHHDPKVNSEQETYAPFCYNQNVRPLIESLSVDEWIVYGNGVDFCVNDTVTGLIKAGQKVTFLSDVLCKSATGYGNSGTEESTRETLAFWRALGAREYTSSAFLETAV